MPRRNRRAQRPRRPFVVEERQPTTDQLAHSLVRRGLATAAILGYVPRGPREVFSVRQPASKPAADERERLFFGLPPTLRASSRASLSGEMGPGERGA